MLTEYIKFIPDLKDEVASSLFGEPKPQIISFLSDYDLIDIYAEWLSKNKPVDRPTQNGFIFEILSRRFIRSKEQNQKALQPFKEMLIFLLDGENQRLIWNEEKSTPDDLVLSPTSHTLDISRIIECKISAHAAKGSVHQKESTKNTVKSLVNVLNGNYQEIKNENGKKIITTAREKLRKICTLPINLSSEYKYVYVLPSDQYYNSQNPKDANLEVLNLPFSTSDIDEFRESYFTYLAKINL